MTSIFAFVIVLGVLIFFHELGHFLVARLFGVGVQTFSLGFGPRLLGKKVGITDYRISAIPLGGFVKMVGEEPDAELTPEEIPLSFTHKHVLKKIFIVAAGPLFNILLAVIIFYSIFQISGLYTRLPSVGSVEPETPAFMAGLQEGDKITAINDMPVESWDEMAKLYPKAREIIFSLIS
jgi:regulator of sigma E protease